MSSRSIPKSRTDIRSTSAMLRDQQRAKSKIGPSIDEDEDDGFGYESPDERASSSSRAAPSAPPTSQGLHEKSIFDPAKKMSRTITAQISGSLADFASGKKASVRLIHHPSAVRYSSPILKSDRTPDLGDPSKGFIFNARVVRTSSTFPCDLVISSNVLKGDVSVSSPGLAEPQFGFITAPAATPSYQPLKGHGIIRCREIISADFVSKYAHYVAGDEEIGVGQQKGDGGKWWFVPENGPLANILKANYRAPNGKTTFVMKPYTGGYEVELDSLNHAREAFKKMVLPQLPIVDMLAIDLIAERAGQAWDAPLDGLDVEIFHETFSLSIELNLDYRLMFESEIPAISQ